MLEKNGALLPIIASKPGPWAVFEASGDATLRCLTTETVSVAIGAFRSLIPTEEPGTMLGENGGLFPTIASGAQALLHLCTQHGEWCRWAWERRSTPFCPPKGRILCSRKNGTLFPAIVSKQGPQTVSEDAGTPALPP